MTLKVYVVEDGSVNYVSDLIPGFLSFDTNFDLQVNRYSLDVCVKYFTHPFDSFRYLMNTSHAENVLVITDNVFSDTSQEPNSGQSLLGYITQYVKPTHPNIYVIILSGAGTTLAEEQELIKNHPAFLKWYQKLPPNYQAIRYGITRSISASLEAKHTAIQFNPKLFGPPLVEVISNLKHRIAQCFLSIDVDLQGVNETLEEKQIEDAVVYLWNILRAKEDSYYKKKLNYVRFLVTGGESFRELAEVTETKDKILSNGSVWDLLKDSCSEKSDVMREWSAIEVLLGINHEGTAEDVKFMTCESMIGKFFDKLDDLMPKYRKIDNENEIRKKAKEYIQDVKEVSNPTWEEATKEKDIFDKINDFHGWFTALDKTLDKLRGDLPT